MARGMTFSADEVFEMAEQIERNGAKFYAKAATMFKNKDIKLALLKLAEWEKQHEAIFADMRSELSKWEKQPTAIDPNNEAALYLRVMADGHVIKDDLSEQLAGKSKEDIYQTAVQIEKDSIAFYVGLKEMVPKQAGKDKIDKIIKEEMRHLLVLDQQDWSG